MFPLLNAGLVIMRYPYFGWDRVIGWGNLHVNDGQLNSEFGYVAHQPRDRVFKRELDAELQRIKAFLAIR
jgi:hypothetical protein